MLQIQSGFAALLANFLIYFLLLCQLPRFQSAELRATSHVKVFAHVVLHKAPIYYSLYTIV